MADQFFSYDAPMPDLPPMQQTYYDPSRLINMAKSAGPQDYSDALPFWKRSEPIRPIYNMSDTPNAPPPVVPVTEPVKHRRTRSGCLTCRARRVKVRLKIVHLFSGYVRLCYDFLVSKVESANDGSRHIGYFDRA